MFSTPFTQVEQFVSLQAQVAVFFVVSEIKKVCDQILHTAEFIYYGTKARLVRINSATAVRSRTRGGEKITKN